MLFGNTAVEFCAAVLATDQPFLRTLCWLSDLGETLIPTGVYRPWDNLSLLVEKLDWQVIASQVMVLRGFSYL